MRNHLRSRSLHLAGLGDASPTEPSFTNFFPWRGYKPKLGKTGLITELNIIIHIYIYIHIHVYTHTYTQYEVHNTQDLSTYFISVLYTSEIIYYSLHQMEKKTAKYQDDPEMVCTLRSMAISMATIQPYQNCWLNFASIASFTFLYINTKYKYNII